MTRTPIQQHGARKHVRAGSTLPAAPDELLREPSACLSIPNRSDHRAHLNQTAIMTVHPMGDAHPYFPLDLHLPGYVPMQVDFDYILGVFFTAVLVVFAATWWLSGGCGGGRCIGGENRRQPTTVLRSTVLAAAGFVPVPRPLQPAKCKQTRKAARRACITYPSSRLHQPTPHAAAMR